MKYRLLFLLMLVANVAFGQTDSTKVYYCEVYCLSTYKCTAYIDLGNLHPGKLGQLTEKWCPVDSKGEFVEFKSCADVLNWMSARGWKVCQQSFQHYASNDMLIILMRKETTKDKVKEGIILKGDQ